MSEHLRLLQEMFPKKIYLDEHDVASVFGGSSQNHCFQEVSSTAAVPCLFRNLKVQSQHR